MKTVQLSADTLIRTGRTTAGNQQPGAGAVGEPETVAEALARDAFHTSHGTLTVRTVLHDINAVALELGVIPAQLARHAEVFMDDWRPAVSVLDICELESAEDQDAARRLRFSLYGAEYRGQYLTPAECRERGWC